MDTTKPLFDVRIKPRRRKVLKYYYVDPKTKKIMSTESWDEYISTGAIGFSSLKGVNVFYEENSDIIDKLKEINPNASQTNYPRRKKEQQLLEEYIEQLKVVNELKDKLSNINKNLLDIDMSSDLCRKQRKIEREYEAIYWDMELHDKNKYRDIYPIYKRQHRMQSGAIKEMNKDLYENYIHLDFVATKIKSEEEKQIIKDYITKYYELHKKLRLLEEKYKRITPAVKTREQVFAYNSLMKELPNLYRIETALLEARWHNQVFFNKLESIEPIKLKDLKPEDILWTESGSNLFVKPPNYNSTRRVVDYVLQSWGKCDLIFVDNYVLKGDDYIYIDRAIDGIQLIPKEYKFRLGDLTEEQLERKRLQTEIVSF